MSEGTYDFAPPTGFERAVRIGVAVSKICPCCQGLNWLCGLRAQEFQGQAGFICDTCSCIFAPVADRRIPVLAPGADCPALKILLSRGSK